MGGVRRKPSLGSNLGATLARQTRVSESHEIRVNYHPLKRCGFRLQRATIVTLHRRMRFRSSYGTFYTTKVSYVDRSVQITVMAHATFGTHPRAICTALG